MARMAREEGLEVIRPELGTRPAPVYSTNLWRYSKCFIGGAVAPPRSTASSIVSRVRAWNIMKGGTLVAETITDNYGDFQFDTLDEGAGRSVVRMFRSRTRQEDDRGASRGQRSISEKLRCKHLFDRVALLRDPTILLHARCDPARVR